MMSIVVVGMKKISSSKLYSSECAISKIFGFNY
jgi:hypothetical protein